MGEPHYAERLRNAFRPTESTVPADKPSSPLNGRDFYLGPHGTKASKLEYDRLIGEWLQQGRQIQPGHDDGTLSVVELIAAYLHHVRGYYRKPMARRRARSATSSCRCAR